MVQYRSRYKSDLATRNVQDNQKMFSKASSPLLLFLILGFWSLQGVRASYNYCEICKSKYNYILDEVRVGRSRDMLCCISKLNEIPNATVTWTFRGGSLDQIGTDNFEKRCNGRTLKITSFRTNFSGNYTCYVFNDDDTTDSFTTSLTVHPAEKSLAQPKMIDSVDLVHALEGDTVDMTCQAHVDEVTKDREPSVSWLHYSTDNETRLLQKDIEKITTLVENVITGTIKIKSVTMNHYGTYQCTVKNSFFRDKKRITLKQGLPPSERTKNTFKLYLVVVLAFITATLGTLCCCWRWRWTIATFYMEKIESKTAEIGYCYDCFIVHGDMASDWVQEKLLPTLEDIYGYTCFVLERDMLGGEPKDPPRTDHADAISQAMAKCRRMLVLITPCLLQSEWSKWTVHHGVSTILASQLRILAITLQELENYTVTSETTGFLKTLQMIKSISFPRSCNLQQISDESCIYKKEMRTTSDYDKVSEKANLQLCVPGLAMEGCDSRPSEIHHLNNLIMGNNSALGEKLNKLEVPHNGVQKNSTRPNPIYVKNRGCEDPREPDSKTPIYKAPKSREEDQKKCDILGSMSNICCGDPEMFFWQKVRVRLGPPSVRQTHITAETIA